MNQQLGPLRLLFTLWLNAIWLAIPSSAQDPYFVHYHTKDGLSSAVTYAVFQDSRGYIWVGSDLGVSRFDGKQFRNYTHSDGVCDNDIFNLFEDSQGRIWLNTFNGAACYFKDEQFYNAENDPVLADLTVPSFISQIIEGKNGHIHLLSNGPISKILTPDQQCHTFFDTSQPNNICFSWFDDKDQHFFARQDGITMARQSTVIPYPDIDKMHNVGFVRAYEGEKHVFFGMRKQVYVFDKQKQEFISGFKVEEMDTEIIHINYDGEKLWLGTRNGIFYLQFEEDNFNAYSINKYLEGHSVSYLLIDREGNYWFSTLDDGVFFSPAPKGLHLTSEDGLPDNPIFCVSKDRAQQLWIGSTKNDYSIFANNEFTNSKLTGLTDLEVTRIRHFGTNEHWILGQGEMMLIAGGKKKYLFVHSDDIAKDRFGYYWFNYRRLYRFTMEELNEVFVDEEDPNIERKMQAPVEVFNLRKNMDVKRFLCLMPDNQDRMWAGTTTGLYWYHYDSLAVTKGSSIPLVPGKITSLAFDSTRNLLWAASSSNGIYLIREDSVIGTINQRDGLSSDFITSLQLDDEQNLWISGVNGVDKVQWTENITRVRPFTLRYGLYNLKVNDIELIEDEVFLATDLGLIVLPNSLETSAVCPPVYITDFRVNRQAKDWTLPAVYSYRENSMEIAFQGLSYRDQGHNAYLYRLVGEDEGWTKTESNSIQYRSLAPGDYSFEVKAKNWASELCAFTGRVDFSIEAPYWQQIWFIVLMGLSLFGLFYLLWKIRIQNITRKYRLEQRLVYAENDKLELEKNFLELEMRALRLQMNPHFMFNALNTIKGYYAKDKTREANAYISKFAQLLRLILKNNDKFISLESEIKILELYIKLTQIRYEEAFDYEIKVDSSIDRQDIAIPPMLLQPMVENAIIHGLAPQNRRGLILISFDLVGDTLVSKIRDNGVGRHASKLLNKHKLQSSQAIQTTEARLAIINKDYDISDFFIIDDLTKEDGSAAGTEVKIISPLKKLWSE